jgi:multisubunit Na+/H+ antiporter MnhG subunit
VACYAAGRGISLHELAIPLFLFITAPVSAHLLGKAALKGETGRTTEDTSKF